MSVCVSRPTEGITLNAGIREYLCHDDTMIIFEDEVEASEFLVSIGFNADDFTDLIFLPICQKCGEPLELYGECFTCGKQKASP